MSQLNSVVAIGELLVDFVQKSVNEAGYPVLSGYPGGAPCNFLSVIAKYGEPCQMITQVGDDELGRLLIATLEDCGIDTSLVQVSPEHFTTLAFVTIDATGDRRFSFARKYSADLELKYHPVFEQAIAGSRVLHFGSLSLTAEPVLTTTRRCVEFAAQRGVWLNFDPNYRADLWSSEDKAIEQMRWGISRANSVKLSEEEFSLIFGRTAEREHIVEVFSQYENLYFVLVTRGAEGATAYHRGELIDVAGVKNIEVVDTTGAGDIFGGSVIWYLLKHTADLRDTDAVILRKAIEFANRVAALSTTKHGGISSIPNLDLTKDFL